jgi:iron complex outermembrane receptor protein
MPKYNKAMRALILGSAAAILLTSPSVAFAQEEQVTEADDSGLTEIVVTARKREERLLDVPIAVSVMGGEALESSGIQQLGEAVQTLPGISVTPTPVGDLLFIRGIGSGENQGFEMSVGTFVDGVYFGRGQSARHAFLDVDRIEVLKGPQPILFGKNTIGGALNITTRRPGDTLEVSLDEYIEPEFGTFRTTGVISGPISDQVKVRIVARSYVTDGFVDNPFLGRKEAGRDDWVVRGTMVWEPASNIDVMLKGEYGKANMKGGRAQISTASPRLRTLLAGVDPNAEFDLDYTKSGPGVGALFNDEYERAKTYNTNLTVNWDTGGHVLTSVSSYAGYNLAYQFDSDFTPLDFITQSWRQNWHSLSQELRFASTAGKLFDYQAGVYVSSENLVSNKLGFVSFAQLPAPLGSGTRVHHFDQTTTTWSGFAEGTLHATEELDFILGYRYTNDRKTLEKSFHYGALGSTAPVANPTFTAIGLGTPHSLTGLERSTGNSSLGLTARYKRDNVMYYASYTQGFKAGGFDEGDTSGILSRIRFGDEKAQSYEVGIKAEGLDRRLRVQVDAFYSKYENLQVSIFDGVASLIVGNAASASSRGVEFEGQFAATRNLTFGVSAAYLDAKYDSYVAGPCSFGRGATCNLTGEALPYSPKFSGSFTVRWNGELGGGWGYGVDTKLFHSSSFSTAGDLDPMVAQSAFTKLDASISLTSPNDRFSVSLLGKNLTNEVTAHFGDDIPLSNILGNNYQRYVDPPRTIAIQLKYKFR